MALTISNKQNIRYWTNLYLLQEVPLQPQKWIVRCEFQTGGVIGPYFFIDKNNRHIVVNTIRYCAVWHYGTQFVKQLIY